MRSNRKYGVLIIISCIFFMKHDKSFECIYSRTNGNEDYLHLLHKAINI